VINDTDAPLPRSQLAAGLYMVATPIGAARDITLRALDVLRDADILAAEDTRQARKIMQIHGIKLGSRQIISYHDKNGDSARPRILQHLQNNKSVAYVSDAGTPLIADPGYKLIEVAIENDIDIIAVPGASAVLTGLTVSGLPTNRFMFIGFLPPKSSARKKSLQELAAINATLVFYESPRRLSAALSDMVEILGHRKATVSRELTKKFEQSYRDNLNNLAAYFQTEGAPKGEVVIMIGPPDESQKPEVDIIKLLKEARKDLSVKDAVKHVTQISGLPRKHVYTAALNLDD